MSSQPTNVIQMPVGAKTMPCDKCQREIVVGKNTVLAYCRECSAGMGMKK